MAESRRVTVRGIIAVLAAALVVSSCSTGDGADVPTTIVPESPTTAASKTVAPDYAADTFVVNVNLTDEGYEPSTIHVPVGRQVKLVLRNHGSHEHHYRVVGLPSAEIRWYAVPEITEAEVIEMESQTGFVDDVEHILHHITPEYVPFKAASLSGIKPLPTEVHGYAQAGAREIMMFFPLTTGSYTVEDVLYPEIVGKLVVFDASS